jgi:diacylglycerol O-acyltransferase / wax synthase
MQRLRGGDAVYLYQETPSAPQHTLKISIMRSKNPSADRERVKHFFQATIHRIPALRWRMMPVPLGLHHPMAVEDPDFDIENHLNHIALPQPGTMRELEDLVGQIAGHPLDRSRPLWEMWMVEGLSDGRVAFVMKAHHAIADGMASVHLFTRMLSPLGENESAPQWRPDALPSAGKLFVDALWDHIRQDAREFPNFLRTVLGRIKSARLHRENSDIPVFDPMEDIIAPSPFNGALSPQRKFATCSLSLGQVRSLKQTLSGTINDVVLALVAGALRDYLDQRGQLPSEPLITIVPVSADEPGTERIFGNNIAVMGAGLHSQVEDPIERYEATRKSTLAGKSHLEVLGKTTLPSITHYLLPAMISVPRQREYRLKLADQPGYKYPCQVAVSNVPGPRQQLETEEAVLEALYSVGPLQEGNGLNITVWSYCDQLNFSIITCARQVPDPQCIASAIENELQRLQEAANGS